SLLSLPAFSPASTLGRASASSRIRSGWRPSSDPRRSVLCASAGAAGVRELAGLDGARAADELAARRPHPVASQHWPAICSTGREDSPLRTQIGRQEEGYDPCSRPTAEMPHLLLLCSGFSQHGAGRIEPGRGADADGGPARIRYSHLRWTAP